MYPPPMQLSALHTLETLARQDLESRGIVDAEERVANRPVRVHPTDETAFGEPLVVLWVDHRDGVHEERAGTDRLWLTIAPRLRRREREGTAQVIGVIAPNGSDATHAYFA